MVSNEKKPKINENRGNIVKYQDFDYETKYCEICGKEIEKFAGTSWSKYSSVKTCSTKCRGALLTRRNEAKRFARYGKEFRSSKGPRFEGNTLMGDIWREEHDGNTKDSTK